MKHPEPYQTPRKTLYIVCPKIIKSMRIQYDGPEMAGRRKGEPNMDEVSGANDIVYHLMCDETMAIMAKRLGVTIEQMRSTLHAGLNSVEKEETVSERDERQYKEHQSMLMSNGIEPTIYGN